MSCLAVRFPVESHLNAVPVDLARFAGFLDREIVTEQVANGVNDLGWWTLLETIEDTSLPLVTGYLGDAVLGTSRVVFGYEPVRRAFTFDKQYEVFNQWGLSESSICALLPGTSVEEAYRLAEEVLERLTRGPGDLLRVDAGVAAYPEHGENAGELLSAAFRALRTAKRVGGSGIVAAR